MLYRTQVDVNEVTGEKYPNVRLIDFHHHKCNHFLVINQFRIDTPGADRACIVPDIVLFVNGLPLAVAECKEANAYTVNPMYEAFRQLLRYSDQRAETKQARLRESEPQLFYTNQLVVCTYGEHAEFGTITSTNEEFFFGWRDIHPETYRTCTLFMHMGKMPGERSGVIGHTQGLGKSLTILFVIRRLCMCNDLKDFKVYLIDDCRDLEDQVSRTVARTGEKVTTIASAKRGCASTAQGWISRPVSKPLHKLAG